MIDPSKRGPASNQMLLQRAQVKKSIVVAKCTCGEILFTCSLHEAQGRDGVTNTLIRQAIAAHAVKGCEKANDVRVHVEVAPGEVTIPGGMADPNVPPEYNRHQRRAMRRMGARDALSKRA
jgi:hypothetical protein